MKDTQKIDTRNVDAIMAVGSLTDACERLQDMIEESKELNDSVGEKTYSEHLETLVKMIKDLDKVYLL
jgi:hypothetical protein